MNITFLIGNGFDLRMGMKTRFSDMYEDYIAKESTSDAIRDFKKMLEADAPEYKTWGDFEMAMAQKAKEFSEESSFLECMRDFKLHMAEHLRKEQEQFNQSLSVSSKSRGMCIDEVATSIKGFYAGLTPNVINEFIRLGAQNSPTYNYISFNYTNVFDSLLEPNKSIVGEDGIIHIHGKLNADVVLGADNLEQVAELPYMTTRRFERAFIKPEFNKSYDNARLLKVQEIIDNSDIICIYGMSLGKSDYSWIVRLKKWLQSSNANHLVYFVHDKRVFNKLNWDAMIDEEEDRIAQFLGRICDSGNEMSDIFSQIHIPIGYDLFGIDEILKKERSRVIEEERQRAEILKRMAARPQELGIK